MSKMNIVLLVLVGGVIVSNVLSWVRIGGGVSREEVLERERLWQDSMMKLRIEVEAMRGEWVDWGIGVERWRARMDSSVVVWREAMGGRKKIEEWFKKQGDR